MRKKLLKNLAYSFDGINLTQHHAGNEVEINDKHIHSLETAGYVGADQEAPEARVLDVNDAAVDDHPFAQVEIIEAWEHLDWGAYRSLGSSLSESPVANKAEATAAIEAELKRREDFKKSV